MHPLRNLAFLIGRFLIAGVFIYDAYIIVRTQGGTTSYIATSGLPDHIGGVPLALVVALCQVVGGIMIVFGFWTRLAALAFAAFCVATAVLFHRNLGSTDVTIQAGKDLATAGGFLFLAAAGPGGWSLDARARRDL